ncbi:GNAT family N-acetyltransferase [Aeromonas hydrophila]|uniref:GNAT family N-acetyltransferase n=1 Tax=Aeromonas hydrophila TaxID=644 RepID=UPI003D245326
MQRGPLCLPRGSHWVISGTPSTAPPPPPLSMTSISRRPTAAGGIGKAAMALLEAELRSRGIRQITLRVAHDNPRALALYQEAGFAITGYNMAKRLG